MSVPAILRRGLLWPKLGDVARPPRDLAPGIQHVGVSAAGGMAYFVDDLDRATWLRLYVATADRFQWRTIAFCLLSSHWHAIVDVRDRSLATGMHVLVGKYTRRFNARHSRAGYLVRDRYWARRKETPQAVLAAFRYVVRNPMGAGLVERPEDWRWSSYATTIGVSNTFAFVDASDVLAEFGSTRRAQIAGLRRFVESS